jgi:TamB, inner membrane protein subunit of TAM complex
MLLLLLLWVLIQLNPVQNWLIKKYAGKLSKDLNTTVSIKHVSFSLLNKVSLEGLLIEDRQHDTLLYAGVAKVNITDWFVLKDKADLTYIGLENTLIKLQRTDSVWNYQFLVDYFSSPSTGKKKQGGIEINLKKVSLKNIYLLQHDGWVGKDLRVGFSALELDAEQVNFNKKLAIAQQLTLDNPVFAESSYTGNRPPRPHTSNNTVLPATPAAAVDSLLHWNKGNWDIWVKKLVINNGSFKVDKQTDRPAFDYFDGKHLYFTRINGSFNNLRFQQDTLRGALVLSAVERSGLQIKQMKANLKFDPEEMEFSQLDLTTNKSHLQDYFSMRYTDFQADMGDFIHAVRMQGNFNNSEIDSDDIAFFAPKLSTWKKRIRLSGSVRGKVDNLVARNALIEAGKSTVLNGNITLTGLPNINETFIDFTSNDFRTTYADAVTFVPDLRKVTQPKLAAIQYVNFKGTFTGFIRDFVTYGTIRTNLGTVVSDLNMKLPENGIPTYKGKLNTENFQLGTFLGNKDIGRVSFNGQVNGSGFNKNTINADVDGTIKMLEYKGYPYRDITVKGNLNKNILSIQSLVSNDPNLVFNTSGVYDLNKLNNRINFESDITRVNLKELGLTNENITIGGKFFLNFTGKTIDDFLGSIVIRNAAVFREGTRLNFDSLALYSAIENGKKELTLKSNVVNGSIKGDFNILDLPNAFQLFLNKYYPSYIKAPLRQVKNQNFVFDLQAASVDEYIQLVDKNLSGFNGSSVSGTINTYGNVLILDAKVPKFIYKNISFEDIVVTGQGSLKNLVARTDIGMISFTDNDRLRFPTTNISIESENDLSDVSVTTSANQTLNSANLAAKVQTVPDGVKISFKNSTFDINGKTWTVEENGELNLSSSAVNSTHLKLSQGMTGTQEIEVFTQPSGEGQGNENDIIVDLRKINIGDFTPFFAPKTRLEGLLGGRVNIHAPFGKMNMEGELRAEQFRFEDDSIGVLKITDANYSTLSKRVNFKVIAENAQYDFNSLGSFDIAGNLLDIDTDARKVNIHFLQKYIGNIFTDLKGWASGNFRVVGDPKTLKYLGEVRLRDASMKVGYTQCTYTLSDAPIRFREGEIDFGRMLLKDRFNDSAIVIGSLKHTAFKDMSFDFSAKTSRLELVNTNAINSKQFYGNARGWANMEFNGPTWDMKMNIRAGATDSSHIYLPLSTSRDGGNTDYIKWKLYGREMTDLSQTGQKSNLDIDLTLTATPLVTIDVIMDDLTGDIITAKGRGTLNMTTGTSKDFTMTGRYEIEEGNYKFSFQSFIKKPFELMKERGNFIEWFGDPYKANISIDARYKADNVSTSDLSSTQNNLGLNTRYKGPVYVVAHLKNSLTKPDITFDIEFPSSSEADNNPELQRILKQIKSDDNEMNKQIAYLTVFNSFAPIGVGNNPNYGTDLANLGVNTITEKIAGFLTDQVSDILRRFLNDKSLKVNISSSFYNGSIFYNSSEKRLEFLRNNTKFEISYSFLKDRLIITFDRDFDFGFLSGDKAYRVNYPVFPNYAVEYLIRSDGKVRATIFRKSDIDFSSTDRTRTRYGASLSYRREFNRLKDLFRKNKKQGELKK